MIRNPALEIEKLKYDAMSLVRKCRTIRAMKDILHCYDILQTTDDINQPWDTHPGVFFGEMSAFMELESISASLITYGDPDAALLSEFHNGIKRVVNLWKVSSANRAIRNIEKNLP